MDFLKKTSMNVAMANSIIAVDNDIAGVKHIWINKNKD